MGALPPCVSATDFKCTQLLINIIIYVTDIHDLSYLDMNVNKDDSSHTLIATNTPVATD